jgi:dTDP-4-dehydrorhamnose reductase
VKIIVTGSAGMLGRDLMERLAGAHFTAVGLTSAELDITRATEVSACMVDTHPDLVINCAAYTDVDKAESEPSRAFMVNRDGAANLADACKYKNIPLIHVSTDYVFNGKGERPYQETDGANPVNVYGRSKWEGEEAVRRRLRRHLIVRTAWLFGVHGKNFVKTILRLARERDELRVVADQYGCPTWTGDLADGLVEMVRLIYQRADRVEWGTYHFCGAGQTSWHGFAQAIIREGNKREQLKVKSILPITTLDYPTPAARPLRSVLDCRKLSENFRIAPPGWQHGLARMMIQLYAPAV